MAASLKRHRNVGATPKWNSQNRAKSRELSSACLQLIHNFSVFRSRRKVRIMVNLLISSEYVWFKFDDISRSTMHLRRTNLSDVPCVAIEDHRYSGSEVLQAFNYGFNPNWVLSSGAGWHFHGSVALYPNRSPSSCCIWDQALVHDFADCAVGQTTNSLRSDLIWPGLFSALTDRLTCHDFNSRVAVLEQLILRETFRELYQSCQRARAEWRFVFPHSYLVIELIRLVKFLTDSVKRNETEESTEPMVDKFISESRKFWISTFGNGLKVRGLIQNRGRKSGIRIQ